MLDRNCLLCFECEWKPPKIQKRRPETILSKVIKFNGEKLFRVGLKNDGYSLTLLFITYDVSRIGMDNVDVTFSSKRIIRETMTLNKKVNGWRIQLHTSQLGAATADYYSFTFQVYLASKEPNYYSVQRYDGLLGKQLWSAAINQDGTDYKLTAKGKEFFVHKFVLAARSPVFAAQFSRTEDEGEIFHQIESASCLRQLLKFMYTGELEGAVSPQLKELAEKYEISQLERLCQTAYNSSQEDDLAEDLGRMALLLKTDADIFETK